MGAKGIEFARIVEVIKVRTVKGDGTQCNPMRSVIQYWEKDGRLIAEKEEATWKIKET